MAPPGWLLLVLGGDAEADAAIEGRDIELDVEALAVLMLPGSADTGPKTFVAFALADVVGQVRGGLAFVATVFRRS